MRDRPTYRGGRRGKQLRRARRDDRQKSALAEGRPADDIGSTSISWWGARRRRFGCFKGKKIMKYSIFALVIAALGLAAAPAQAVGCLSGAAAGAVAGHYAGHHALLGAIGGCIAGHHMHKVQEQQKANQAKAPPASPDAPK
jgi:hypothetical protein